MIGKKCKFFVERSSFGVQAMVILLALSAAFRVIGCWGLWTDRNYAVLQIALPVFSALLMIALVWFFGKRALWLSFVPVLLGAVFFIVQSLGFETLLHTILCIVLYVAVVAIYFCTVFGLIRTKWILAALFGLPFLYHVFVEDLPALQNTANPVTFSAGMQEMGVLCIMLGLFFLSLSMKKEETVTDEADLPKMKGPKVLFSQKQEESAEGPAVGKAEADPAQKEEPVSAANGAGAADRPELHPEGGSAFGADSEAGTGFGQ